MVSIQMKLHRVVPVSGLSASRHDGFSHRGGFGGMRLSLPAQAMSRDMGAGFGSEGKELKYREHRKNAYVQKHGPEVHGGDVPGGADIQRQQGRRYTSPPKG
jgi:hypothetical protein